MSKLSQTNESQKKQNQNIFYTDKSLFDKKFQSFITSFLKNKKSVAVVTDFDYTITARYDYKTGKEYKSSYYLYDEDIIGGNQQEFNAKRKDLADKYSLYEFSTSHDLNTRKKKVEEWYQKTLGLFFNEKFTLDSIDKMIEITKNNILFRKHIKEYIELLISLGITVIIESGGIGNFIQSVLKSIIPNFESYVQEKKIIILSNFFKFDPINKGCCGLEHGVINSFNKADFLGDIVKRELPELEYVMVLGDNLGDADSIKKINVPKENIIGLGFLNLPKEIIYNEDKKEYLNKKIEENKKKFDVTLVGECDYEPIIEILKRIKI